MVIAAKKVYAELDQHAFPAGGELQRLVPFDGRDQPRVDMSCVRGR